MITYSMTELKERIPAKPAWTKVSRAMGDLYRGAVSVSPIVWEQRCREGTQLRLVGTERNITTRTSADG